MSWDLFVQDLPQRARAVDEIPGDFEPASLGSRTALIQRIRQMEPATDFSDPAWGRLEGEGYDIEINLGADESVRSFALHIRGDQRAVYAVHRLLSGLGLRALDPSSSTGIFSSAEAAAEGFLRWKAYRDSVVM